jgi:3-dehydroquinate dehydratase I
MDKPIPLHRSCVIGVIHTMGGVAEVGNLALDAVELRIDALPYSLSPQQFTELPVPAILTVRRLEEGGVRPMTQEEQRDLYFAFLPVAAAVDVEIQSTKRLQELLEALRREEKALIVSFHDFEGTPSLARLRTVRAKARDSGADVVKIATKTERPTDVARLLVLLEETSFPLAVMGMGSLGRASRLLFAKAGSVLNYGWLDQAQIAGQWSAREFLELLGRD